ncbi:polysaccharide biosynthesis tyrosine autokinase [Algoriphagus terrigena]|uniref:polysaccharide biosynthesis tyrosine autokinase n=1 Tax=Algoriphagus terrigena TaxID=344884 RepID=UPI00040399CE|nr:tyrosine-protein kinase family protein [Algoriphagus terrigena]
MKASDILLEGFFQKEASNPKVIKQSLNYYLRYWKLFLVSVFVCFSAAFVYLYYYVPVYSVSSAIMLKDDAKGSSFFENPVLGELEEFQSSQITENEVDVLGSAELIKEVFEDLNYHNLYYTKNLFGKLEALPDSRLPFDFEVVETFPNRFEPVVDWQVEAIQGETIRINVDGISKNIAFGNTIKNDFGIFVFKKNELTESYRNFPIVIKFYSKAELAGIIGSSVYVEAKDKNSSIIYIWLDTEFPERGVAVLDGLVDTYNENALEEKKEVVLTTLNFLDSQLYHLSSDLAGIQYNIEQFKSRRNVVDIENDSKFYQENALEVTKQLADYQNQLEILRNLQTDLKTNGEQSITLGPLSNNDPALLGMIGDFNKELDRLLRLRSSLLPENPVYVNSLTSLNNFRDKINNHIQNRISAMEITLKNVESTNSTFSRKSNSGPMLQREYEALTRDLEMKQEHYLFLIKKREETSLYLASVPTSHSKSINRASFFPVPVSPKPSIIYGITLLISLIIPFGYLFVKRSMDEKLEDKSLISNLSVNMLGELSEIPKKERGMMIDENHRTPIAEQLRYVRTSYCLQNKSNANQVVLITSTVSGEGKTFFAMNFAKSLAMTGKKTAVLSYDLRKPQIDAKLVDSSTSGLSGFLSDKSIAVEDFLKEGIPVNGFTFFQSGNVPRNPGELIINERNRELIDQIREHFDYVIIDSSPVGQVADALALVPLVDSTIYLMRYNWTSKQDIEFFQQLNEEEKLVNPLVVLNGCKVGQGYGYGYYQYS